jgi:c-type cytochrome biogenesis protein CcmF
MDLAYSSDPIILLTFLIDALFGLLAAVLIKKIFAKQNTTLFIPLLVSTFAIVVLLFFYLNDATTIANVWLNSHKNTPLLYKIAGIWGNHEGSMLLFYTLMTMWSALLLRQTDAIRLSSFVLLAIGSYLYLQANPFEILAIKATTGQDLNPALQNPYLAIHPPILYAGQTLCFVLWIWACVAPDHPRLHFYTRVCFGLITLGLALGARWAYGELGWGGFWFWDPVETVSLFPWLAIGAALHAGKRASFIHRLCLLISFPMVMLGMTLVRSGVLVSVHSFGFDLYNGLWLGICTLAVCVISGLVLYNACHPRGSGDPVKHIIINSRLHGNDNEISFRSLTPLIFLGILAIFCILILGPVILKTCFAIDIAVDENFFHQYINPCLLILLTFAGLAPRMVIHGWNFLFASLCTAMWCLLIQPYFHLFATLAALVGFWLISTTMNFAKQILKQGFIAAHIGVGFCILGASHSEIFSLKQELNTLQLPQPFASHTIKYVSQEVIESPQVTKEIATLLVDSKPLKPERHHFHISKVTKHQPAWINVGLGHIHATAFVEGNSWKVELMTKPLISLFWLGIVLVLVGVFVSTANFLKKDKVN